ncbi:MAG: KpsF/GutQ family protein, arabinose-5-phosphate isomerase, partial [Candidatus Peregrinibacteria bacterium GW2011_GWF2_33_10]
MNNKIIYSLIKNFFKQESVLLEKFSLSIDDNFIKTVECIDKCNGKIIFLGMGKSGLIARKISSTFSSIGIPSFFINPAEARHGDLGSITKNDLCVFFSNSGNTQEIVEIFPTVKNVIKAQTIAIIGNKNSYLAKNANLFIDLNLNKEDDYLGIVPTLSTAMMLAIGDAISIAMMHIRNLKREDFAKSHPGGILGKKLTFKIEDIMEQNQIPFVKLNSSISEVIHVISAYRKGAVIIKDRNNHLIGIITDGDLRRAIEKFKEKIFT